MTELVYCSQLTPPDVRSVHSIISHVLARAGSEAETCVKDLTIDKHQTELSGGGVCTGSQVTSLSCLPTIFDSFNSGVI